jgi:hypothetical protein
MVLLNLGNLAESLVSLCEPLFLCNIGKVLVKACPFQILSCSRRLQVGSRVPYNACGVRSDNLGFSSIEKVEEELGVLLFIVGCLEKDGCNLLLPLFSSLARKKGVPIPRLGLPGESG